MNKKILLHICVFWSPLYLFLLSKFSSRNFKVEFFHFIATCISWGNSQCTQFSASLCVCNWKILIPGRENVTGNNAKRSNIRGILRRKRKNGRFAERARRNVKDCRAMCKMCSSEKRNFAPNWSPSSEPKQISVEPSTKRRAKYISLLSPGALSVLWLSRAYL